MKIYIVIPRPLRLDAWLLRLKGGYVATFYLVIAQKS